MKMKQEFDWVQDWMKVVGGTGFMFFLLEDFKTAIRAWNLDLKAIRLRERQGEEIYHKGMWYFNIGLCYEALEQRVRAISYYRLALREDKRTYGRDFKNRLAYKKLEEVKTNGKKSN